MARQRSGELDCHDCWFNFRRVISWIIIIFALLGESATLGGGKSFIFPCNVRTQAHTYTCILYIHIYMIENFHRKLRSLSRALASSRTGRDSSSTSCLLGRQSAASLLQDVWVCRISSVFNQARGWSFAPASPSSQTITIYSFLTISRDGSSTHTHTHTHAHTGVDIPGSLYGNKIIFPENSIIYFLGY